MRPLLIYIHGFNSSSQSAKAQEINVYLQQQSLAIDYLAPSFANYPGEAHRQIEQLISDHPYRQIALIGSSLGGFMTSIVAERHRLKACMINPVVRPSELMPLLMGENTNDHTGESFFLDDSHTAEIETLESHARQLGLQHPENYLLMLQTGDETLDYRQAQQHYQRSSTIIEEGGSHRFEGFDRHLPQILSFLALT